MIENDELSNAKAIPIPPDVSPVTVYGNQDAMDDFPVLKAFQQYVDSEQAKAHKRLMTVCAFFTILIFLIIGVFIFVVMNIRTNINTPDATVTLLQRQFMEQTSRMNDQLIQHLTAKQNIPPPSPTPASVVVVGDGSKEKGLETENARKERELANREAQLKKRELEEARKALDEREKALKEREEKLKTAREAEIVKKNVDDAARKKEKEILEYRRKLYPEYFDEYGNEHVRPVAKNKPVIDARDAEIERLKKENQIVRLKAEIERLNRENADRKKTDTKKTEKEADDIDELEKILENSGVYGNGKKFDELPDVLNIDIAGGDWSIPLE